jgi:hypothetical protein
MAESGELIALDRASIPECGSLCGEEGTSIMPRQYEWRRVMGDM